MAMHESSARLPYGDRRRFHNLLFERIRQNPRRIREIVSEGENLVLVAKLFLHLISCLGTEAEAIGGLTPKADLLVAATLTASKFAEASVRRSFFVKLIDDSNHTLPYELLTSSESVLDDATPVAVCAPEIVTGGSLLTAALAARRHFTDRRYPGGSRHSFERKFDVRLALAVVDRQVGGARAKLEAQGIKVMALMTEHELKTGVLKESKIA